MKYHILAPVFILSLMSLLAGQAFGQAIEPTDEEQYLLELINRTRMDPANAGAWMAHHPDANIQFAYDYFHVDREQIINDFATYPPVPPLAWNEQLTQAARRHTKDLKDNNFQGHIGTDGSDPSTRIEEAGYDWWTIGENVYSYGKNADHAFAGFAVDWGVADLGHRKNILEYDQEPRWREAGIGILRTASAKVLAAKRLRRDVQMPTGLETQATPVGPLLVTIDFAATFMPTPQLLGVVYQDVNENQLYDIGEGLGGITISIENSTQSTVTFSSGGYQIPFTKSGEYTVTASGGLLDQPIRKTFKIGSDNVKIDFRQGESTSLAEWALY